MSGEVEIITSMDDIWAKIDPHFRHAWEDKAVQVAINDPKVQTMAGLLPHCSGSVTPEEMKTRFMSDEYDAVPPYRYEEVFREAAAMLVQRELGTDG